MPALAPLSADMYLPAPQRLKQSFAASEFYAQLSIASFFVAFALGQLVYRPLSDKFSRLASTCGRDDRLRAMCRRDLLRNARKKMKFANLIFFKFIVKD